MRSTFALAKSRAVGWLSLAPLLLVGTWPLFLFWRAALGWGQFYFGDIARFFYPTRVMYAEALRAGRIGLWAPDILLGFPLFAEMQTGALYPPHLFLYRLLPIDLAINYDVLLHLGLLGTGTFLFARGRGISRVGSAIGALAFSTGGFGAGRVTHMSVLAVAAWLPWLLLAVDRYLDSPRLSRWACLVLLFALQFLAGHPQFMLLNVLTFGAYAFARIIVLLYEERDRPGRIRNSISLFLSLAAVVLAGGIAAVQLWPTAELAQASARAGGVTEAFFTEFSFHPFYLALMIDPFLLGNPYPRVSVEVIAYVGAFPFLFAGFAAILRPRREVYFWLALICVAFLLALGGLNPLYRLMRYLPVLNYFRVPARFLFPLMLALAILAGFGLDALVSRFSDRIERRRLIVVGVPGILLVSGMVALSSFLNVDQWLRIWQVLPFIFWIGAAGVLVLAFRNYMGRATFLTVALILTLSDLAAFNGVYAQSFNAIAPRQEIFKTPRVLDSLLLRDGARTRTSEWIYPWVPEMRETLYPNLNAAFGVPSAQGYTPLVPRRTQDFFDRLSPVMLNLVGARYYLIPQVLPVDSPSEAGDLNDPFLIHPVGQTLEFMPTPATNLEVESSLAQSVNLRDGDVVANVLVATADHQQLSVPLRAGIDTAEWAYERADVRKVVKHSEPPIASSFAARSANPVQEHIGHTYLGNLVLGPAPVNVVSLRIEPVVAAGLLFVQKLTLVNNNSSVDVAVLTGKGQHRLVYRSEDVAVFENRDYAPRTFITHNAVRAASDEEALARLGAPDFTGELLLADGQPSETDEGQLLDEAATITLYEPERVQIKTRSTLEGYLVLADAWDAGWVATVDGLPAPIYRADVVLRAVPLPPGQHTVEFQYRPKSFFGGLILSGMSLLTLVIIFVAAWLWGRTRQIRAHAII